MSVIPGTTAGFKESFCCPPGFIGACICPCCTAAGIRRDALGSGCIGAYCFSCCIPCLRGTVRSMYAIPGSCFFDYICGTICWGCSLGQLKEEVAYRRQFQAKMAVMGTVVGQAMANMK